MASSKLPEREESYAYSLAEFLAEHIIVGLVITALTLVIIFIFSVAR
jgi:hypothetical protein